MRVSTQRPSCDSARGAGSPPCRSRRSRPLAALLAGLILLAGTSRARAGKFDDVVCTIVGVLWTAPSLVVDIGLSANIAARSIEGQPVGRGAAIAEVVLMPLQLVGSVAGLGLSIAGKEPCPAVLFSLTTLYSTGLLVHGAWVLSQPSPMPTASEMSQPLLLPSLPPPRLHLGPSRLGSGLGLSLQGSF